MPMSINRHATVLARTISATGAILASWLAVTGLTIAATVIPTDAEAKTPGSTYCFYGVCHRVKSIAETEAMIGKEVALHASFYDDCKRDRYNPCGLTSSGERFHPDRPDNAASPIYPDGTTLLLWNPDTEKAAVVRVNNAGPYWGKRKLDVSRATAERLGFKSKGTAKLKVRVMKAPKPAEAKYRRNRKYKPVPGAIGRYKSVEEASAGASAFMALDKLASALLAPITGALFTPPPAERAVAGARSTSKQVKRTASHAKKAHSGKRHAKAHRKGKSVRHARSAGKKRVATSRRSSGKSRAARGNKRHERYAAESRSGRRYNSRKSNRRYGSDRPHLRYGSRSARKYDNGGSGRAKQAYRFHPRDLQG